MYVLSCDRVCTQQVGDLACTTIQTTVASIQPSPEPSYLQYTNSPHYAPLLRHWERQRQLIAVTCIAEHA